MEAHVFERASAFGEVGAGIQMTPNAVKIMRELGVGEQLQQVSLLPQCIVGRNWRSGAEVFRTPLSDECPRLYGAEFFHTHRGRSSYHPAIPSGKEFGNAFGDEHES
jgi:salicylate hydroxylase